MSTTADLCKGCKTHEEPPYPFDKWVLEIDGVQEGFRTCPRRLVTERSALFLNLYSHYRRGHLFCAGGIMDQPALYETAMRVIANEVGQPRQETED